MKAFTKAKSDELIGTSYQGVVDIDLAGLIKIFGAPHSTWTSGKCRANWVLKFADGTVATIYDYRSQEPLETMRDWHIGGRSAHAVECVYDALHIERVTS